MTDLCLELLGLEKCCFKVLTAGGWEFGVEKADSEAFFYEDLFRLTLCYTFQCSKESKLRYLFSCFFKTLTKRIK